MSQRLPWPQSGDRAFVPVCDERAFRVRALSPFFPHHPDTFRHAAERLLDDYLENETRHCDELFLPIAYLYRHALEVRLKSIVSIGLSMGFIDRAKAQKALENHGLAGPWTLSKRLIIDRWSDGEEVRAAEAVINEFHRADPTSQTFRYLRAADGKLHRHEQLPESVSPEKLRRTMDCLFTFLESCYDGLDESLRDMRASAI